MLDITGTCNFPSVNAANRYYSDYGYSDKDVQVKIEAEEIKIGLPTTQNVGDKIILIDKGLRYAIQSNK